MQGQLGQLMQQAQRMQEEMKRVQEEITDLEVTGNAGGGMVTVTMRGNYQVVKVRTDRSIMAEDPDMTEDLVAAAINDAVNKIAEMIKEKMGSAAAGINLLPGFKMPS